MTRRARCGMTAAAVATMLLVVSPSLRSAGQDTGAIAEFQRAVQEYARLEQRLGGAVGDRGLSNDANAVGERVETLAAAMREARVNARRGDLFTPAVANSIRQRIQAALLTGGYEPADVLRAIVDATRQADSPMVNGRFSWATAAPMLPCILLALPELPEVLQYRFVRRDLVLVDINANLIVDVLPGALAAIPPSNGGGTS